VLNLPYSEYDSKPNKEEVHVDQNIEFSMEKAPEIERFTGYEEGETSSKRKSSKSQKIKKLKEKIAQYEVLERVIKARYETLSKNFVETSAALEILALESVKEKKEKKRIIKDNRRLWRLARHLKKKVKNLKAKIATHPDLHVLVEVAQN